jgi:hypothetical protein
MKVLVWISLALVSSALSLAASLSPFVFVMIDSQTETRYGTLPFNRALIAKAIDKLAAAKAKGIILKFFYDLPSTEDRDLSLEMSICAAPVALQATLNDVEGSTNTVEEKFIMVGKPLSTIPPLFADTKGFIPLRRFSKCAQAVGFVDSTATEIPLLEVYQGHMVKSLWSVALEMASNRKVKIDDSGSVWLGEKHMSIMHPVNFPSTNTLPYIPFHDVLDDTSKTWQSKVQQSIVILGYDGKNIHSIETPIGPLSAHRFFINALMSVAKSFEANAKPDR